MAKKIKEMFLSSTKTKLAAIAMKGQLELFKKLLDYKEVGGAPLLGVEKPVIKAHGSSNAVAIKNAIRQAAQFAESDMIRRISENISQMKLERSET